MSYDSHFESTKMILSFLTTKMVVLCLLLKLAFYPKFTVTAGFSFLKIFHFLHSPLPSPTLTASLQS